MLEIYTTNIYTQTTNTKETTMTEPRDDDDTALGKDGDCEYCGNFVIECTCNSEPDRMYGDDD